MVRQPDASLRGHGSAATDTTWNLVLEVLGGDQNTPDSPAINVEQHRASAF